MSMSFHRPAWSHVSLVATVALAPSAVALPTTPVGTFSRPGDGSATAVAVAGHHAYVTYACGDGCYRAAGRDRRGRSRPPDAGRRNATLVGDRRHRRRG